jgi:hypothetical protein
MKKINSEDLTIIERRLLARLKNGQKASKLGNKVYFQSAAFVTKEFQIGISNVFKLADLGLIKIAAGGRIELIENN